MQLRKFPSIDQFRHVVEAVRHRAEYIGQDANDKPIYDSARPKPRLTFQGTVKLHGTNAGIAFDLVEGTTEAQSRERILSLEEDHQDFCAWSMSEVGAADLARLRKALLDGVARHAGETVALRVYGEWVGKSVNAKTGIGQLPTRWVIFDVLATHADGSEHWLDVNLASRDWQAFHNPDNTTLIHFITDYQQFGMSIDFNDPGGALDGLEQLTMRVEESCPVAQALGGEGIGEGIVWVCHHPVYGRLVFKTKGTKHKGTKNSRLVQIEPEVLASLDAFTDAVLTESRLEQGFDLIQVERGKVTADHIGDFLKWVGQDVMKEESDTLKASGLDRKMAMGRINARAKTWLLPRLAQF